MLALTGGSIRRKNARVLVCVCGLTPARGLVSAESLLDRKRALDRLGSNASGGADRIPFPKIVLPIPQSHTRSARRKGRGDRAGDRACRSVQKYPARPLRDGVPTRPRVRQRTAVSHAATIDGCEGGLARSDEDRCDTAGAAAPSRNGGVPASNFHISGCLGPVRPAGRLAAGIATVLRTGAPDDSFSLSREPAMPEGWARAAVPLEPTWGRPLTIQHPFQPWRGSAGLSGRPWDRIFNAPQAPA